MKPGSRPTKTLSRSYEPPQRNRVAEFPLEEAHEAAADARDIIRDLQRRELPSYHSEDDQPTGRHEINVTVHTHSQPDVETEIAEHLKAVPKAVRPWVAVGVVLGSLALGIATALGSCHH